MRASTLLWMIVISCAAYALYLVKYEVQSIREQASAIEQQLQEEREALHIANAEWAYLNRPERLQSLADKYLKLAPLQGTQIVELAALPFPETGDSLLTPASATSTRPGF